MSVTPPSISVNLCASPPFVGMVQIWGLPASSGRTNARWHPSGENLGLESLLPPVKVATSFDGMSIIMICDLVSALSLSTWDRTKASLLPSGDTDGEATLTSSYTSSGVMAECMARGPFSKY